MSRGFTWADLRAPPEEIAPYKHDDAGRRQAARGLFEPPAPRPTTSRCRARPIGETGHHRRPSRNSTCASRGSSMRRSSRARQAAQAERSTSARRHARCSTASSRPYERAAAGRRPDRDGGQPRAAQDEVRRERGHGARAQPTRREETARIFLLRAAYGATGHAVSNRRKSTQRSMVLRARQAGPETGRLRLVRPRVAKHPNDAPSAAGAEHCRCGRLAAAHTKFASDWHCINHVRHRRIATPARMPPGSEADRPPTCSRPRKKTRSRNLRGAD